MKYIDLDQFFKLYLRTKQHWNKKVITMQDAIWQELKEDTFLFGKGIPAGSIFKCFETSNFGWIVFKEGTKDCHGRELTQRIFKY